MSVALFLVNSSFGLFYLPSTSPGKLAPKNPCLAIPSIFHTLYVFPCSLLPPMRLVRFCFLLFALLHHCTAPSFGLVAPGIQSAAVVGGQRTVLEPIANTAHANACHNRPVPVFQSSRHSHRYPIFACSSAICELVHLLASYRDDEWPLVSNATALSSEADEIIDMNCPSRPICQSSCS